VCPEGQEKHQHQGVRERGGERKGPAGVSGVTQRFLHRGRLGWFLSIIRAYTFGRTDLRVAVAGLPDLHILRTWVADKMKIGSPLVRSRLESYLSIKIVLRNVTC